MLTIGLGLGAAALAGVLASRSHANRDARSRRALQAADAGIQSVLYAQNQLSLPSLDWNGGPLGLSALLDCVVPTLNASLQVTGFGPPVAVNAANVCPSFSGSGSSGSGGVSTNIPVGDHAYYQVAYMPGASGIGSSGVGARTLNPKIVAAGFDDGGNSSPTSGYVTRRIEAILAPINPFQAVEAQGNLTFQGLKTAGVNVASTLNGNARANGSVSLPLVFLNPNLSGALIGSVTYGTSFTGPLVPLTHAVQVANSVSRTPVTLSTTKAECSDQNNAAVSCATALNGQGTTPASPYNAATNTFTLTAGTVTFPPGDYVFCSFSATGGTVTANSSTANGAVRIFVDKPTSARCNSTTTSAAQHQFNDTSDVNRGNFNAANGLGNVLGNVLGATGASGMQVYVVGDGSGYDNATSVNIGPSGAIQNYIVYAPTSAVTANNCTSVTVLGLVTDTCFAIQGSIIGDNVTIKALAFTQDLNLSSYPLYSGLGAFHVQEYRECPAAYPLPSPDPTTGC